MAAPRRHPQDAHGGAPGRGRARAPLAPGGPRERPACAERPSRTAARGSRRAGSRPSAGARDGSPGVSTPGSSSSSGRSDSCATPEPRSGARRVDPARGRRPRQMCRWRSPSGAVSRASEFARRLLPAHRLGLVLREVEVQGLVADVRDGRRRDVEIADPAAAGGQHVVLADVLARCRAGARRSRSRPSRASGPSCASRGPPLSREVWPRRETPGPRRVYALRDPPAPTCGTPHGRRPPATRPEVARRLAKQAAPW